MFENILLPLDGSPLAEAALPAAEHIASRFGAKLWLLQVVPPADASAWMAPGARANAPEEKKRVFQQDHDIAERYLNDKVRSLEAEDVTAEAILRIGDPVEEILACINAADISLVVMATHGRGGLSKLIFGSVAEKVVHRCHVPVMLVRPLDSPEGRPS